MFCADFEEACFKIKWNAAKIGFPKFQFLSWGTFQRWQYLPFEETAEIENDDEMVVVVIARLSSWAA